MGARIVSGYVQLTAVAPPREVDKQGVYTPWLFFMLVFR